MNQQLALVFPGQGSQKIGMLGDLARTWSLIKDTFEQASAVLDYDLWALVQTGPEADLNRTDRTQPALLTASVALWRLWLDQGGARPAQMAGHSLGEYSALVCAGVLDFEDAVRLVRLRGEAMQAAVPEGQGAMAAILGLEDAQVEEVCQRAAQGQVVAAANYNAPGQVVIAGEAPAVERALTLCKEAGARRAMPLAVSVPSHCALMRPAADRLAAALEKVDFADPRCQLVQNVTAEPAVAPADIKRNLVAQLDQPVRWTQSVGRLVADGAQATLECGPGKVLGGLNKRIHRQLEVATLGDADSLASALAAWPGR